MTTKDGATRLMKSFRAHNRFWTQDMERSGVESALMTVMRELANIVGEAPVMLCAGNLVHNVGHGKETYDADGNVVWPVINTTPQSALIGLLSKPGVTSVWTA